MASTAHTPSTSPRVADADGGRLLADAISLNAIFSGLSGLALLAGAWALDGVSGVDAIQLAVLGAVLLAFAAALLRLLATPRNLRAGARGVIAADLAWVACAAVLVAARPDVLSTAGVTALAAVTVVVAALAVAQWLGLRRTGPHPVAGTTPIAITVERVITADPDRVWNAVADAGDYARFADGIAETEIVEGAGQGMVRICTDERGDQWRETCTLWEQGRRYRMTPDVSTYPWHYRALLSALAMTWELDPVAGGTHVRLRFDGAAKLGVIGRLAVRAMTRGGRIDKILDAYEREVTAAGGASTHAGSGTPR